jgi:CRISPR/Cas system-associated exonuclease Cas4 (RecB family)
MAGKRTRNLYSPGSATPFRISRSKIENFIRCPFCFYLDVRLGVGEPAGYPFNLNSAVDHLLKKEFDIHRTKSEPHPLMTQYGIDAVPFMHRDLDKWRENFTGVQYFHEPTNFLITGAVDDVWVNPKGELIVVDYKATSKDAEVTLDAEWQGGYKRQMEIYQWLLEQNGFSVSRRGYFVYANGKRDRKAFDARLEFDVKIIPYDGDSSWVDGAIKKLHTCLNTDALPLKNNYCEYCLYREAAESELKAFRRPTTKKVLQTGTKPLL